MEEPSEHCLDSLPALFFLLIRTPKLKLIGLFVDAKPDKRECIVEELIFEAQTRELYEKYRGGFEKSLTSIEWDWN